MFIGDYPAIHNGSLLYIVQHEGHFRVIVVKYKRSRYDDSKETIDLHRKSDYSYQTTQFYVNTSEAERKSVLDKIRSCSTFREGFPYDQNGERKQPVDRSISGSLPHQIRRRDGYCAEPNDKILLICDY